MKGESFLETFLYWLNILMLISTAAGFFRSLFVFNVKAIFINGALLTLFTYLQFFYHG